MFEQAIKSITKYDQDGYLMDICPHCNSNISYKYNKTKIGHVFISEFGYFDRIVTYQCKANNKYLYIIG